LILRKCEPDRRAEVRRILEKDAFGELERLVTQKILDVVQGRAREELRSEEWLRLMAQLSGRSYEQMRVAIQDLALNERLAPGSRKRFEFVEVAREPAVALEAGLERFLKDKSLSGDVTGDESEILKMLRFKGRRPSPLYYDRELQNLRDELHFPPTEHPKGSN
jgi:hypothetical protein